MTAISPVPVAISSMNADRHHPYDQERQQRHQAAAEDGATDIPDDAPRVAPPAAEIETPPEGPFAASQLAERLQLLEANLRLISAAPKAWTPPQFELNLRDRTV